MITIYLTRHSKTVWNDEKRLQGRLDSPLTKEGLENAEALKKHIQNTHFDYVYSSPTLRAYKTAQILFDDSMIIKDDRLLEMNFGIFEGRKIKEILETDHDLYYQLWHQPELFTRIKEGESYDEVIERLKSFITDLQKLPDGSHVLVVTHGMCFIVLLGTMLGYPKKDFVKINQKVVDGCSLTCLEYDGAFTLKYYNDCSFLPHVASESFAQ